MKVLYGRILFSLIALGAIVVSVALYAQSSPSNGNEIIDSFEECASAGYPIMESYPEQCAVPGGGTFTKQY